MRIASARPIACGLLLAGLAALAPAQSIYTCVDAKGRRLTADRPIPECSDREQKELNSSGTLRRKIGPQLTAEERAAEEAKQRAAIEEKNRIEEQKKRDRALLTRYPNKATHDKERVAALAAVDEATKVANDNTKKLLAERKKLDEELEFYRDDPKKVPQSLKRRIDENAQHLEAQKRFVDNQDGEKKRVNERFDEEQKHLKPLWAQAAPAVAAAAPQATATASRPATAGARAAASRPASGKPAR